MPPSPSSPSAPSELALRPPLATPPLLCPRPRLEVAPRVAHSRICHTLLFSAMLTASRRSLLRRTRDAFLARWGLLDWLRLLWCSVVLWYEFGIFYVALWSCPWPDTTLPTVSVLFFAVWWSNADGACHLASKHHEKPAHVLLVADPQVRDLSTSRRLGFSAFRQFLVDLALKRNWHFASRMRPHVVVFLGDLLPSWRFIKSDDE